MAINPNKLTVKMHEALQSAIIACFFLLPICTYGQIIQKDPSETVKTLLTRMAPENSTLATCPETDPLSCISDSIFAVNWNSQPCLIAFYERVYYLPKKNDPSQDPYSLIIAEIFFDMGNGLYYKMQIDSFDEEGDIAQINALFFANADKEKDDELIILVSWVQRHYDVSGMLYHTFIYKDLKEGNDHHIRLLKNISDKLSGGCDCSRGDGSSHKAKFTNITQIKKGLKRLGYK
jgi:hypothetical protein